MDRPGAFILLFRGNEKESRLDIKRFMGEILMPTLRYRGDLMCIDLGDNRELAVSPASEELNPDSLAYLQMSKKNWFVALPFQANDERNLHFFEYLIRTLAMPQFCLIAFEEEVDQCNAILWSLSQTYPTVAFYLETMPFNAPMDPAAASLPENPQALPPLSLSRSAFPNAPMPEILIDIDPAPGEEPMEEAVFCVICQENFTQGMVTVCCCQVLCAACYSRVRERCPTCRASPLQVIDGVFDSNIAYKNDNIEEQCICGKVVKRRDKQFHDVNECPARPFECSRCNHKLPMSELKSHLQDIHKEEVLLALVRLIASR